MVGVEGSALAAGMALGTASTLSVGPNNLMLVREGLVRGRTALVASGVCASYLALLTSALMMADAIASCDSALCSILSWSGVAALAWFAYLSLRAYVLASTRTVSQGSNLENCAACVKRIMKTVWLNPLTYIEMLFIPSSIDRTLDGGSARVMFTLGTAIVIVLSCYGYAFGAISLARFLRQTRTLRFFDLGSGVLLFAMSCLMGADLALRHS